MPPGARTASSPTAGRAPTPSSGRTSTTRSTATPAPTCSSATPATTSFMPPTWTATGSSAAPASMSPTPTRATAPGASNTSSLSDRTCAGTSRQERVMQHPVTQSHRRRAERLAARRGFNLTELLIVIGLISVLVSLLMPVVSKVRAAASSTTCLSNLHHMSVAWSAYIADNAGQLPPYVWHVPLPSRTAWYGYWAGILDQNGVRGEAILCPSAREPWDSPRSNGFGNVSHAWTGRQISNGSAVRLSDEIYRTSSYGFNRFLSAGNFSGKSTVNALAQVTGATNVPAFLDCAYPDVAPGNFSVATPPAPPPDLRGATLDDKSPQHWRFLLGRHGRGINVAMADGSARWVRLDDTYQLKWHAEWSPYRLELPAH